MTKSTQLTCLNPTIHNMQSMIPDTWPHVGAWLWTAALDWWDSTWTHRRSSSHIGPWASRSGASLAPGTRTCPQSHWVCPANKEDVGSSQSRPACTLPGTWPRRCRASRPGGSPPGCGCSPGRGKFHGRFWKREIWRGKFILGNWILNIPNLILVGENAVNTQKLFPVLLELKNNLSIKRVVQLISF